MQKQCKDKFDHGFYISQKLMSYALVYIGISL